MGTGKLWLLLKCHAQVQKVLPVGGEGGGAGEGYGFGAVVVVADDRIGSG